MATVRGDIFSAVVTALEGVAGVFRVVKAPAPDGSIAGLVADVGCKGKCVLEVYLGEDDVLPESQGMNHDALSMHVGLICHVGVAEDLDTSDLEDRVCELLADVYEAMTADPTWGGKALDTRVQTFSTGVMVDPREGVGTWAAAQAYLVRYRFRYGDPAVAV